MLLTVVAAETTQPGNRLHRQTMCAISAGIAQDAHFHTMQRAVSLYTRLKGDGLWMTGAAAAKFLRAGQFQTHRPSRSNSQMADDVLNQPREKVRLKIRHEILDVF